MAGSKKPKMEPRTRVVGYRSRRAASMVVGRYGEAPGAIVGVRYEFIDGAEADSEPVLEGVDGVRLPFVLDVDGEGVWFS